MHELVIVGAGPAGLTAGLYAGRARLKTIILEKMSVGGRILMSESIENYPGFPGGISTHELIQRMEEQVRGLGVEIINDDVLDLDCKEKTVKGQEKEYRAKAIIIATGARPRKLQVAGEDRFIGKGVSYCATCDAPFFKNKKIVIAGGGNAVAEEALYLARFAESVTIVHRRDELRASPILQEKLKQNGKISFLLSRVVAKIEGETRVSSVTLKEVSSQKEEAFACDGIFIYIGYDPDTLFIKDKLKLNESGFVIADRNMETSERGIFACGDCCEKPLYQVITACSDGAVASESAYKYITGVRK